MADNKQAPAAKSGSFSLSEFIHSKTELVLFLLVSVITVFVFKDFLFLKKIYLFKDIGSDTINMEYPLLVNLSEAMRDHGVPYWSFSQGMGQNVFPLWLGDFSYNFVMLFSKENFPKVIAYMEPVKIILCALIFFKYLQQLKLSRFACMLGALLYSFTGYVILGGTWTIFSTEAVYVALILLGLERWLNAQKWFLFLLGIFLLTLLQPFYLYPYAIFLSIYLIVRYNDVKGFELKSFFLFGLKTIGIAALGVLTASFQLLPDILMLMESPRFGGEAGLSARLKAESMFGLADPLLRFTTTFRAFGSDTIGVGSNFRGWQNYLEAPILYCGILSLVAFPHVFSSLNKRQLRFYIALTILFVLPILFPYFRYIFWAFAGDYFRTLSLVICIILLFYSAKAISYIEEKGSINKIVVLVTAVVLLFLLYTPKTQFQQAINDGLRAFVAVLILAYSFLLFALGSNMPIKNRVKPLLLVLCFVELLSFSYISVNKRDAMTISELKGKVGYNDYSVDALDYARKQDQAFFRVNKDYGSGLAVHGSINDGKAQSFYGTSSYHSFNQKNYIKFLGDLQVIDIRDENSTRWARGLVDRPLLFTMASGKYWLSKRPESYLQNFGYDSIRKFGDVKLYKNRYAVPFGFTYTKMIDYSTFKTLSNLQKDLFLLKGCVVDDADMSAFSQFTNADLQDTVTQFSFEVYGKIVSDLRRDTVTITHFSDNVIEGTTNFKQPKIAFFSIPFDEGWSAKLNGAEVKLYRVNCGFTGMIVPSGNNKLELSFEPRLMKKGLYLSTVSFVIIIAMLGLSFYRSRRKEEV
jgi:uncharacterized membrane protein YfhO